MVKRRISVGILKCPNEMGGVFKTAFKGYVVNGLIRGLNEEFGVFQSFMDKPFPRVYLINLIKIGLKGGKASGT